MDINNYKLKCEKDIISPSLIYYKDIIIENTKKAIEIASGTDKLWPHVKSHKISEMVKLQMGLGISRFKCATIAEAEMLADCGAKDILLAYPLVGPNIKRFIKLQKKFPGSTFWAIGDNLEQLRALGQSSIDSKITTKLLVDANVGMDRTGVLTENLVDFYMEVSDIEGLDLQGFHCYDGHLGSETDIVNRQKAADEIVKQIKNIKGKIESKGLNCSVLVMGGTPTFPCYAKYKDLFLSPGTLFISDYGYLTKFKDMDFTPGAAILTRVISCPQEGCFTLDLGYKHIASDPKGARGKLVGFNHVINVSQSEEHWAFKVNEDYIGQIPKVGDVLYVVPTHVCPTTALYSDVIVAQDGEIVDIWKVIARDKRITI